MLAPKRIKFRKWQKGRLRGPANRGATIAFGEIGLKAPEVPKGTPVVNALSKQRECIINIFRACIGLQPDNHMMLEYKKQQL